jgi:SAM-dependent methyltransferase
VCSSRIIEIQGRMSERAIELLALPDDEPKYILDIGCGSGLSGDVIEEHGHMWVGVDISPAMLGARACLSSPPTLERLMVVVHGDVVPLSLSRLT